MRFRACFSIFACAGLVLAMSAGSASATPLFKVIYSFCPDKPTCAAGSRPTGLYAAANGDLYGTGQANGATPFATGFIFKLKHGTGLKYRYSEFYNFPSCADADNCPGGYMPQALVIGRSGTIYGLTQFGGVTDGTGVLFGVSPKGKYRVLHKFCSTDNSNCLNSGPNVALSYAGASDGEDWDETSPLYGTTFRNGKAGFGAIFMYDPATKKLSTIYSFCKKGETTCLDGVFPNGVIAVDDKSLYGINLGSDNGTACGIVYRLNLATEHVTPIHAFPPCESGITTDGQLPIGGVLLQNGLLSGLTQQGGASGHGALWQYTLADKNYAMLDSFCPTGCGDEGFAPFSNLVGDSAGNLYGATEEGGANDNGTVFEALATGGDTTLHPFVANDLPVTPIAASNGSVFGTTSFGGDNGEGSVYVTAP